MAHDYFPQPHSGVPGQVLILAANGGLPSTGAKDPGDDISMQAGIDLYNRYGSDLTQEQLNAAIVNVMDQMQASQAAGEDISQVRPR